LIYLYVLLCLILISIPTYFRYSWNDPFPFIGSDPQIKYYQTIQILEKGFSKDIFQCYFPAANLGFGKETIPLGYPWAFLKDSGECFFQYPLIMPFLHSILAKLLSIHSITYLPILFFGINIFITGKMLERLQVSFANGIFYSTLLHGFTPLFLSSLDYSELTLTNFSLLSTLYFFLLYRESSSYRNLYFILSGLFFALNFQLRPESTIGLFLFFLFSFLLLPNPKRVFFQLLPLGAWVLLLTICASYLNYILYEHPLGMRGWNTLTDVSGNLPRNYFSDWVADLWGSDFKIGIFQGYPVLLLLVLLLPLRLVLEKELILDKISLIFFVSGTSFLLFLPILSPYRAGVDIFGMRYYETGVYLVGIGSISILDHWKKNSGSKKLRLRPVRIVLFGILLLFYFSYKSDLRALKNWTGGVNRYREILTDVFTLSPDLIVHRGLSLSYLMGVSYLKIPQIAIYSQKDWNTLETKFPSQKIQKILYLEWEGNPLVKDEFPQKIWQEKFDISFQLEVSNEWKVSRMDIGHFKGTLVSK
jgi:hypothetical protein